MRLRFVVWIAPIAAMGLSATAWAQKPASTAEAAEQPKASSGEISSVATRASGRAVEDLLRKRIDTVDWREKTFEEVLDWLRDQGDNRVNIVPRWGPLGVESVNRESLVTLQLNNTTVGDVLSEALTQLSEEGDVRYRGFENKLTISTRQDFERKLFTKVYDATDLMFRVPDFGRGAPQIDLQKASQNRSGGGGGGGGGSGGVFGGGGGGSQQQDDESGQQAEQTMRQRMIELRNLIQDSIARETWDRTGQPGQTAGAAVGGGKGRIEIFNRSLVVTNTIEVHEMIGEGFSFGN